MPSAAYSRIFAKIVQTRGRKIIWLCRMQPIFALMQMYTNLSTEIIKIPKTGCSHNTIPFLLLFLCQARQKVYFCKKLIYMKKVSLLSIIALISCLYSFWDTLVLDMFSVFKWVSRYKTEISLMFLFEEISRYSKAVSEDKNDRSRILL